MAHEALESKRVRGDERLLACVWLDNWKILSCIGQRTYLACCTEDEGGDEDGS